MTRKPTKTANRVPETKSPSTPAVTKGLAAVQQKTKITPVVVRRKEMVERIVASSGLKPNAVKSVLDAVLEELGNALSNGESLNLHPLGKVTVNRNKKLADKEILVCKIRRKLPEAASPQPMETAAE